MVVNLLTKRKTRILASLLSMILLMSGGSLPLVSLRAQAGELVIEEEIWEEETSLSAESAAFYESDGSDGEDDPSQEGEAQETGEEPAPDEETDPEAVSDPAAFYDTDAQTDNAGRLDAEQTEPGRTAVEETGAGRTDFGQDDIDLSGTGQTDNEPSGTGQTDSDSSGAGETGPEEAEESLNPVQEGLLIPAEEELSGQEAGPDITVEEIVPEGTVLTEEGFVETFVPVENGIEDTDNDDAFAGYVDREMELTGSLDADSSGGLVTTPRKKSNAAAKRLTGNNLAVYAILLSQIREVAAGTRTNTVFEVTLEDLGIDGMSWSAEDLGVAAIVSDSKITGEATAALRDLLGISFLTINRSLLADCPFDLYWYDKTAAARSTGFSYSAMYSNGQWRLSLTGTYTFSFPVSPDYSLSGAYGTFETDPSVGLSVQIAHDRAVSIVENYRGRTDYEKLDGYRREICSLAGYNHTAAGDDSIHYGDPWQLIWVFDGEDSTGVVCEGYSKAFQYLCDLSSFQDIFQECISVTGSMGMGGSSEGHMWNIVALRDGRNYLVDLTNCDSGMIGSGNGGRNLFLVGTGDSSADTILAQGSPEEGYTFAKLSGLTYEYDSNARDRFGDELLTLGPGRVDETYAEEGLLMPVDLAAACAGGTAAVKIETAESSLVYTGEPLTPAVSVTFEGAALREGTDYTLSYADNLNAGTDTASVTISGTGSFCGSVTCRFSIGKAAQSLTASDVTRTMFAAPSAAAVSGAVTALSYKSSNTSVFTVHPSTGVITPVKPGTAKLTITAAETGNYRQSVKEITVTIRAFQLLSSSTGVTLSSTSLKYTGKALTPAVTKVVDANGRTMAAGTDYSVGYSGNINAGAGTAKVTITGRGSYSGSVTRTFTITKAAQVLTVKLSASGIAAGKTAVVTVSGAKGTKTFRSSNTGIASVAGNGVVTAKKVGTVTITVGAAATANYLAASKSVTIKVLPCATTKLTAANQAAGISLSWARVPGASGYDLYRGSAKIRTVSGGNTVTYTDTKAGTNGAKYVYRVTARAATGVSPLSRSVTVYRLARPVIKTVKNSSAKKIKVTWGGNTKSSGWQVQCSLSANFTSPKTVTVSKPSAVSGTVSGLQKKKTYYVRVRALKKSGGTTWYSAWSQTKKVKIKK